MAIAFSTTFVNVRVEQSISSPKCVHCATLQQTVLVGHCSTFVQTNSAVTTSLKQPQIVLLTLHSPGFAGGIGTILQSLMG